MGRIRLLPELLANQIAAGEVVQRPASIVKELVENALDAGAGSIIIALKSGGKREILIRDDGSGMDEEDALLAFERHATSKIASTDDLMNINSFGFRGEALPSIASVSQVHLVTAARDGEGVTVRLEGGRIFKVEPVGSPRGTEIQIRKLFFNTPARRKFLKSTATEYQHCLDVVTRFTIINPEVSWLLEHDGNTVLQLPAAGSMVQRIAFLFGSDYPRGLMAFEGQRENVRIHGYLGNLFLARSNRSHYYFYVNRRPVQNKTLLYAVSNVMKNVLPKGKFPVIFVSVDLEPQSVDVNVHPAKTEVRFREEWIVYELLSDLLSELISRQLPKASSQLQRERPVSEATSREQLPLQSPDQPGETVIQARLPEAGPPTEPMNTGSDEPLESPLPSPLAPSLKVSEPHERMMEWDERTSFFSSLRYVGQVLQSFIIFESGREMVMIDQHAAHERILFEDILDKLEHRSVPIQHLLLSDPIDLSPAEFSLVQKQTAILETVGFLIEEFGKNTVLIRGVPAWLGQRDPRPVLLELIDEIKEKVGITRQLTHTTREELARILSCKTAIKVHRMLSEPEVAELIRRLSGTRTPFSCPHGRPVIVRFTFHDFEKLFKR